MNTSVALVTFKSLTDFIAHNMAHDDMVHSRQFRREFDIQSLLEFASTGWTSAFSIIE